MSAWVHMCLNLQAFWWRIPATEFYVTRIYHISPNPNDSQKAARAKRMGYAWLCLSFLPPLKRWRPLRSR